MTKLIHLKLSRSLCLLVALALPYSNAAADELEPKRGNGVFFNFGLGHGNAIVEPNTNSEFYEGTGFALALESHANSHLQNS